jgi:hypothetical protein
MARSAVAIPPIPACCSGYLHPTSSVNRVWTAMAERYRHPSRTHAQPLR